MIRLSGICILLTKENIKCRTQRTLAEFPKFFNLGNIFGCFINIMWSFSMEKLSCIYVSTNLHMQSLLKKKLLF